MKVVCAGIPGILGVLAPMVEEPCTDHLNQFLQGFGPVFTVADPLNQFLQGFGPVVDRKSTLYSNKMVEGV